MGAAIDILETKCGQMYPKAILGVIWPLFPCKMWKGAFVREGCLLELKR